MRQSGGEGAADHSIASVKPDVQSGIHALAMVGAHTPITAGVAELKLGGPLALVLYQMLARGSGGGAINRVMLALAAHVDRVQPFRLSDFLSCGIRSSAVECAAFPKGRNWKRRLNDLRNVHSLVSQNQIFRGAAYAKKA